MSGMALPGLQGLAGALRITPGAPPPHGLQSSRQDWAARLGHGVPAASLPGLMASLFNLCSHAHRLCSQLAIGAAAPGLLPPPSDVAERMRRETALEHIRRIGLDWPRLLATGSGEGAAPAAAAALRRCPQPAQDAGDWNVVKDLFAADTLGNDQRRMLLSGKSADGLANAGPIVCACFGVGRNTICETITSGARSAADIGARLKAGTNCGSCRPAIAKLLIPQQEAVNG